MVWWCGVWVCGGEVGGRGWGDAKPSRRSTTHALLCGACQASRCPDGNQVNSYKAYSLDACEAQAAWLSSQ